MKGCPGEESLAAYASRSLDEQQRQNVDEHLLRCAACLQAVQTAHRRINVASEVRSTVPSAARAAVRPVAITNAPPERIRQAAGLADLIRAAAGALTGLLRPKVLAPVALTALVAIVMMRVPTEPDADGIRGTGPAQTLRVTANEAEVFSAPSFSPEALAVVHRGDDVVIVNERGAWYLVRLSDGTEGWMDRSDFD